MRKNLFLSLLICSIALLNFSCSKDDDPAPVGPTTTNVSILSMSYNPASVTVKTGSIVKFTNTDVSAHTVTSNSGPGTFNSGNIPAGGIFNLTTGPVGTYNYNCTIHGVTMAGTIVVTN